MAEAGEQVGGSGAPAAGAPAATPSPWSLESLAGEDRGWAELKYPGGLAALAKAHRSLESHLGAPADRLLRLPRDEKDAEGWNKVLTALGRPEKADGYDDLPAPDAGAEDLRDWFKGVAHEAGLTKAQARKLAEKFVGFAKEHTEKAAQGKSGDLELAARRIREKWGNEHDANMGHAERAVKRLGWSDEALTELRDGGPAGAERALEMLAYIGRNLKEDGFPAPGATASTPFGGTPQAHQAAWQIAMSDRDFMSKVNSGDPVAVREFRRLSELAYPDEGPGGAGGPPR
jgi:hypothetical protein